MTERPAAIPATTCCANATRHRGTTRRARSSTRGSRSQPKPRFFHRSEWRTLEAACDRIMPQPDGRAAACRWPPMSTEARRPARPRATASPDMPQQGEAWRRGLAALDEAARRDHGRAFARSDRGRPGRDAAADGRTARCRRRRCAACRRKTFLTAHVIHDVVGAYYAHPTAWNEIGWGGPACPRGYVRLGPEPARPVGAGRGGARPRRASGAGEPPCPLTPSRPRAPPRGRAPDVFRPGGWVPMREYDDAEAVDFVVVGTGAGGGPVIAGLAEQGYSVVGFDAGPYFRPLEDFASDETRAGEALLERRPHLRRRQPADDGRQEQRQVGRRLDRAFRHGVAALPAGMVQVALATRLWRRLAARLARDVGIVRPRREGACRSPAPSPIPGARSARAIPIARTRSTARRHCWPGAPRRWAMPGPRRRWPPSPRRKGDSPPCVYRGFCRFGCSTNAKQSQLVTFIPRALAAGAEIRDLAMVGPHRDGRGRARDRRALSPRGPLAVPEGPRRRGRRLRHRDAAPAAELGNDRFPDGLANSSGLVGSYLMSQSNQAAFGYMDEVVRAYKAPPSTTITEHWNYDDHKDFFGGYCWMAQGPLPIESMTILTSSKGLWGAALHEEMLRYNHLVGLKMVGEQLPNLRQPRHPGRRQRPIRPAHPAHHLYLGRQRQGHDPACARSDEHQP